MKQGSVVALGGLGLVMWGVFWSCCHQNPKRKKEVGAVPLHHAGGRAAVVFCGFVCGMERDAARVERRG